MSEPKTRPTSASVEEFLDAQPPARRADCDTIVAMMRKATGEAPVMWGPGIVGFGRYLATRSDGKTYEWPVIGFSPRKGALVLYVLHEFAGREALLGKLGKHTTGQSCLYVKRLTDVDTDVLESLVHASVKAMAPRSARGRRAST